MARMIPDYVHVDCKSGAERKLFSRFRDELPADYTVLHSLSLAKHQKKLRAEIDFVVISNRGALCIEVKGGRVELKNGLWTYTDRYNDAHNKRESPFEQASSNMYALKRSIETRFGKKSAQARAIFGYSVFFPDIQFSRESPEWDTNRLVDIAARGTPLSAVVRGQFDYSESEITRVTGGIVPARMSVHEMTALVMFLRGEFDFVPSLSVSVENAFQELLRLTEEQYEVLDQIGENPRVVVHGRAGTGKTVIAVEMVRRAAKGGRKVLYVCYNRLLASRVRAILEKDGLQSCIRVSTLHSYARDVIVNAGMGDFIKGAEGDTLYRQKYPEAFAEAFVARGEEAPFDALVVDEGQDLKYRGYLEILNWVIKGGMKKGEWLWVEDDLQNIFNRGGEVYDIDLRDYAPVFLRLSKNCRNTESIGYFTSLASGTEIPKCILRGGDIVEPVFYRDAKHQFRELENMLRRLLGSGIRPGDIVILTPVTRERSVLGKHEKVADISIVDFQGDLPASGRKTISHCTIHGFKGLEAKVLVVTDIEELDTQAARQLNYVGLSRGMAWLGVLINEKAKTQYEKLALEYAGKISSP